MFFLSILLLAIAEKDENTLVASIIYYSQEYMGLYGSDLSSEAFYISTFNHTIEKQFISTFF